MSIKSIQTDHELFVMWNGQLTAGEHVELDLDFAKANKLQSELIIINSVDNIELADCQMCHAELLDSSDYTILSQHSDLSLLDTCKLITCDLVIPIFISQYVKVLVKITSFEPSQPFGILTKWTEMSFQHNQDINNIDSEIKENAMSISKNNQSIQQPDVFLSCALGINYKPKFHLGSMLICGDRGSGKTYFINETLEQYKSYHNEYLNCKQLRGKRPESVKKMLSEILALSIEKQPAIIALDDIDSFLEQDLKEQEEHGQDVLYKKRLVDTFCNLLKQIERQDKALVVVIASCRSLESLDKKISEPMGRGYFNRIIKIEAPTIEKRVEILKSFTREHQQLQSSVDEAQYLDFATRCKSFMPADLRRLFERALLCACSRSSLEFNSDPVTINANDLMESLNGYIPMSLRSVPLQAKTAKTFESIGGMDNIKSILTKSILLPIKYPKLYSRCPLKPQNSILLYGPPGCGKTLIAEALINQVELNSICVRGPELLSKYIGASEAAVRDLFKRAHLARPCVIFFDEFESLVTKRGSDSTGVTDRVVNQFLTILDGVERMSRDIFIIAATSRPDMIDPAILRPGRLDKHLYCPPPDSLERLAIFEVISTNMKLSEEINLTYWAQRTEGFTGADIQAILLSAQIKALHEIIDKPNNCSNSSIQTKDELEIIVHDRHLSNSYNEMAPSLKGNLQKLLEKYPAKIGQVQRQRVSMRATLA